jgi:hypothetical protein
VLRKHPAESPFFGNIQGSYGKGADGLEYFRTITCQLRHGIESEQEANARLIASAPDLLAALEELTNIVQGVLDDGVYPRDLIDSFTLQPARAALKKARGE